jgi:type VI secretion system secreted protein VgrG
MATYLQAEKPLIVTTPLGPDVLVITKFRGRESISQLFSFELELLAERGTDIHFEKILGESVTVEMRLLNGAKRYFNGLVKRFSQGARDFHFVAFRAEVVPRLWLWSKKVRSRIFQQLSVPDILRQVFTGLDVNYQFAGTYYPRDYCVQYRESDFHFASRLMEEEGISYFFKHADGSHQLVVTDMNFPVVPGQSNAIYEETTGGEREDMRITGWEKIQELRAGECALWDHCFELPANHLEAKRKHVDSLTVGKVVHKLGVGGNDQLEIYDYPGGFAQRFDGIDPNGGPRPADLKRIFEDRDRTVRIRMEQEDAAALEILGTSDCGHFSAGHKFNIERHFDADGQYLLARVDHDASMSGFRSNEEREFNYSNHFACVPAALRYRPQRVTAKPVIAGVQTATVVGPQGEEIFCDKYGRVKVQFHWDREGKKDAGSSCWVRVAQVWAGKGWGAFFWPRIGHEVVVTFEEGDPDQPLIVGSVYNAENMPWFMLPANKELAGFKSASVSGTAKKNYNGIVFNDNKGHEHLSIHSEHNLSLNSEFSKMIHAGRHKGERVGVASMFTVGKFIPSTGGSGGGFDAGNPVPEPPPTGITGLNSVVTFGDQFQAAGPVSQQLTMGTNLQMCVSTGALIAEGLGVFSAATIPPVIAQVLASATGSMQFTIGASAQFTLGQSYEISIGPPKIELHKAHSSKYDPVRILCVALGVICEIFWYGYDAMKESGDEARAIFLLSYQAVTEAMLIAIMLAEYLTDTADWIACDAAKVAYEAANGPLGLWKAQPKTVPILGKLNSAWSGAGQIGLGLIGIGATVFSELVSDKAQSQ